MKTRELAAIWAALVLVACGGNNSGAPDAGIDAREDAAPGADAGVDAAVPEIVDMVEIPDWVIEARIGGADVYHEMDDEELMAVLEERKAQNVSVLELDSRLSDYLSDAEFAKDVAFLDHAAQKAHELDMRAVIYYPSLEVLTPNGANIERTMYKEHPDWVQYGIDGTPNVFYGNLEHWVEPDAESAWMSPNSPYRDYLIERVRALAGTALDGVWLDVPVYLETGTEWPGAGPYAAEAFAAWSAARGDAGGTGHVMPTDVDFDDPAFRAWVRWRHENLAQFLEDIRQAAHEVDPDFMIIVETFPVDNVDATSTGLDGAFRISGKNFIRVWEIDSLSNTQAMKWSTYEDFNSKIAMNKYVKAIERKNQAWVFSYGFEPLDAALTMAAAVATGVAPFEAQTPEMTLSVDSDFRTRWFGFVEEHAKALLATPRHAEVGIWYSSATRDYVDLPEGGAWGMYITEEAPIDDPDWWADGYGDTALPKPHLGGWRGAAHVLTQLGVPFSVITDPGNPAQYLAPLELLWMPSVAALSEQSARRIRDFVAGGGVLLATGRFPGTMDELGAPRQTSVLAEVFGFGAGETPRSRATAYGQGYAIYRPDLAGASTYALAHDWDEGHETTSALEQILRLQAPDLLRFDHGPGVHVEVARPSDTRHYLYVINYTGLQLPLVQNVIDLTLDYRPPAGYRVAQAEVFTPDLGGQEGLATVIERGRGLQGIELRIDQFALVALDLLPAEEEVPAPYAGPTLPPAWQDAVDSGLAFVLDEMRNPSLPAPYSFGVFTNLIDHTGGSDIYAYGHHVTAEHMGLLLRVSACLKAETAYEQAYRYVRDAMVSPLYGVVNWAVDRERLRPFIELSDETPARWLNANAPLDDFRVVRGLLAGPGQVSLPEAGALADRILDGLYWTSVTDRDRDDWIDYPAYPGGLVGFAWDWEEIDDAALQPAASSTGLGYLTMDLIPVDYQDLYTISLAARRDPRWQSVLESATELLLDAEIASSGLFYNGLQEDGTWTGDFENQDKTQGLHLKTIQTLWIALHLARASTVDNLDAARRDRARAAAQRSLATFRAFYDTHGRVPEYLQLDGSDVPACEGTPPPGCLIPEEQNFLGGEARIYAQLARLALWLGDQAFATELIEAKILSDRVTDPSDPRHGLIGVSTANENDADAWNVLESLLTICLAAGGA